MRWWFLLLFLSCAHAPVATPPSPPVVVPKGPWYGDLHALAERAAKVRGLTLTQPFEVVPLEDEAFFAEYAAIVETGSTALQHELETTLGEFLGADLASLKTALASKWNDVRQEQLVAFYHFKSHRLLVRAKVPPALDGGGERKQFMALAHEVGHVLQDQLGALNTTPATFDEAITLRAVIEGDATFTATLLDAEREGIPVKRAVERTRLSLGVLTTTQLIELSGLSPKLLEAPPVLRELFLFPYFRGQRFMADLYQAGGLELVTWALLHPPKRTDALFSPQRWLDGSAPPLNALGEPPRRLGLLLFRTLVEQCEQRAVKPVPQSLSWVETHYVDDSFRRAGRTLSWATAWDFESGAPRDENASLITTSLLKCMGVDGDDLERVTTGNVLGLVAGAPGADRLRLATSVSRLGRLDAEPARAGVHIPPPSLDSAFRVAGPGVQSGDTWAHAKLGLSLAVTGGRMLENPGSALTLTAPGAVLFVMFVDEAPTKKGDDGFVNAVLDGFLRSSKLGPEGFPLSTQHAWTPASLAWTAGRQTTGEFDGPVALRALVLPVCGAKASVNVISLAFSPSGQKRLDAWVSSLQGSANPPVCTDP
jgi:hypothetical protein